jgi:hypothetical protein
MRAGTEGRLGEVDDVLGPGRELAVAIDAALPAWVERCVDERHRAALGPPPAEVVEAARSAGDAARADVSPRVRALLEADVDDQWTTPLALVRQAVPYPTRVLAAAGVPPVARDRFEQERFPDDAYHLTPATFADLGPGVADPAIVWGAAKAWAHRRRHGPS